MKYLAVLLISTMLVACGGGGSDASAPPSIDPSPVIAQLAKYEGVWRQDCVDHMRLTRTSTATSSTAFSVTTKEEYFDNADCTGALVATGSFGQPDETVQYTAKLAGASVQLSPSESITTDVDPATSVLPGSPSAPLPFTVTFRVPGSGGTSTYAFGWTFARIEYANGEHVIIQRQALSGQTTHGALLIRNDELLALVPTGNLTTEFAVNRRYIR